MHTILAARTKPHMHGGSHRVQTIALNLQALLLPNKGKGGDCEQEKEGGREATK